MDAADCSNLAACSSRRARSGAPCFSLIEVSERPYLKTYVMPSRLIARANMQRISRIASRSATSASTTISCTASASASISKAGPGMVTVVTVVSCSTMFLRGEA